MSNLTKEEKIKLICEQAEKHDITAYEFGTRTSISIFTARKILLGETKNPSGRTLNEMLNFIEEKTVGSKINGHQNNADQNKTTEESDSYFTGTKEILTAIGHLHKTLRKDNDAFAKALEMTFLNTEDLLEKTDDIFNKTSGIDSSVNNLIKTIESRSGRRS